MTNIAWLKREKLSSLPLEEKINVVAYLSRKIDEEIRKLKKIRNKKDNRNGSGEFS